jgi:hypothetical protein
MTPAERSFDTIESLSQWLKCSRGTVYNLMADGMPYLTLKGVGIAALTVTPFFGGSRIAR